METARKGSHVFHLRLDCVLSKARRDAPSDRHRRWNLCVGLVQTERTTTEIFVGTSQTSVARSSIGCSVVVRVSICTNALVMLAVEVDLVRSYQAFGTSWHASNA